MMESVDIVNLLGDFVLAVVIYLMSNRIIEVLNAQIKVRDERIKQLEAQLEEAKEAHIADLRDWSGIDPRFKTWRATTTTTTVIPQIESDTNIRNQMKPP